MSAAGSSTTKPRAQLPLIDRLLDTDVDAAEVRSAAEALERLQSAVLRDLESLLNARRRRRPLPAHAEELGTSIAAYGIPDPSAGSYLVPELRAALVEDVAATIRRFEPRLADVVVALVDDDEVPNGGTLRLTIDAVLRAEPVPEPMRFETLLEPVSRDVTVRSA